MRIPETIDICNRTWRIVFDIPYSDGEACEGLCDRPKRQIILNPNLKGNALNKTFLHELFHALTHEYSITQTLSEEVEEIINDVFANFLIDNFYLRLKEV